MLITYNKQTHTHTRTYTHMKAIIMYIKYEYIKQLS